MNLVYLLITALGIGVAAHLLAVRRARAIQESPNPIPYDTLREELVGERRFVERDDGTRIHVVTAGMEDGDGPTVMLSHGYGVDMGEWNLICKQLLALGWRCIAFDQRGHGRSSIGSDGIGSTQMASDYEAVLREFDVHDAVLVGHSVGGFLSLKALLDVPGTRERVRALLLVASTAGEVLRGSPQNRLQVPLIRIGVMQAVSRSPTYSWLFGASLCGEPPSPAHIQVYTEMFAAQHHEALLPIIRALSRESYYDRLQEITVPTIVLCGEHDHTTPRWHSEQLGIRIPEAQNVWLPGTGHFINWEAPEAVVTALQTLRKQASH